jgi:hypothetical protein
MAGGVMTCVARKPVSLPRIIFGQAILVISGQRRMMYQNLKPKPEVDNLFREVKASGAGQNSSRRNHHYKMAAESIIRGAVTC